MILFNKFKTSFNIYKNKNKKERFLEIGPGNSRIEGFETMNIVNNRVTDYILDARDILPFPDETFDLIYASHILEHIPWYQTMGVLKEWKRVLKKNGKLEIWVPDGLKIAKAFVDAEQGNNYFENDAWFKFNPEKDPCVWANGRIFTYGDGKGTLGHPNWHFSIFSSRYLLSLLLKNGFQDVRIMDSKEVRGYDHKWINLGVSGSKI